MEETTVRHKAPLSERFRIPLALVTLVAWGLITGSPIFISHPTHDFLGALSGQIQWGILCAGLFALVVAVAFRWRDVGLNLSILPKSLRLLWLPSLYLVVFALAFAATLTKVAPPSAAMVGTVLLNTLMGGFSEEMMFRGVLYSALRTRLPFAAAVTLTTVLFGAAHLMNAAVIGSLPLAGAQAVAAAISGVVFIAIRVRTGSLWPAIIYHALWDFGLLMAVTQLANLAADPGALPGAPAGATTPSVADFPPLLLAVPALLLLPNLLYALYLLRRRRSPEPATAR